MNIQVLTNSNPRRGTEVRREAVSTWTIQQEIRSAAIRYLENANICTAANVHCTRIAHTQTMPRARTT